jgi:hypothetical protein
MDDTIKRRIGILDAEESFLPDHIEAIKVPLSASDWEYKNEGAAHIIVSFKGPIDCHKKEVLVRFNNVRFKYKFYRKGRSLDLENLSRRNKMGYYIVIISKKTL